MVESFKLAEEWSDVVYLLLYNVISHYGYNCSIWKKEGMAYTCIIFKNTVCCCELDTVLEDSSYRSSQPFN